MRTVDVSKFCSGQCMSDKLKIIIELERKPNGVVSINRSFEGEGFMNFEVVGLLELIQQGLIESSRTNAAAIDEVNPDKPTRMKYETPEQKENV